MKQKRIATIQDMSSFGKCSLTVAHPILSAMGLETCPVPTALLSNHTGGFKDWYFKDLTDTLKPIAEQWHALDLRFDAFSTGYLGNMEEIDLTANFFALFPEAKKIVDPVFADHGKLYAGFDMEYARGMRRLCGKADLIVPNLTEAAFLLEEPMLTPGYSEKDIHDLLKRLADLGCQVAAVTGVIYDPKLQGAVMYDREADTYCSYFQENIDAEFHGTGDVFTSVLAGGIALGLSMEASLKLAVDYTVQCIKVTLPIRDQHWYGVIFETELGDLIKATKEALNAMA